MRPRQRPETPAWVWVGVAVSVAATIAVGFAVVASRAKAHAADNTVVLLKDNPGALKGKTLTLACIYRGWLPLPKQTNGWFEATNKDNVSVRFMVFCPPRDGAYPNLDPGDKAVVTFVCAEGETERGNQVVSVTRAP